jgi:hypothetical protein
VRADGYARNCPEVVSNQSSVIGGPQFPGANFSLKRLYDNFCCRNAATIVRRLTFAAYDNLINWVTPFRVALDAGGTLCYTVGILGLARVTAVR